MSSGVFWYWLMSGDVVWCPLVCCGVCWCWCLSSGSCCLPVSVVGGECCRRYCAVAMAVVPGAVESESVARYAQDVGLVGVGSQM